MLFALKFMGVFTAGMCLSLPGTVPACASDSVTGRELREALDRIERNSAANQSMISRSFDQNAKKKLTESVESHKGLVESSLQKAKALAALNQGNPSRCSLNQRCGSKNPTINPVNNETARLHTKPLVFISSSMPVTAIQGLAMEAKRQGARLIIRGMVNNSMKETGNLSKEINHPVDIDPRLFKKFEVRQVPTFALPYEDRGVTQWRLIRGNITLAYAFEKAESRGSREQHITGSGEASTATHSRREPHP